MFHKIKSFISSLLTILEPETWVYIIFILSSMNIGTLRPYLIVVILFIAVLYLVNQNLMNSVWLSFVGVYLLRQSKYFTRPYLAPDNYTAFGLRQPEIIYFVAFADMLLILLLCLLVRKSLGAKSRVFSIPNKFPSLF